jgi:hypothetical protein
MMTRLLLDVKNGDTVSRLGDPQGPEWKSRESWLARLVIMLEVLMGEMYSQSSTILKHIQGAVHADMVGT